MLESSSLSLGPWSASSRAILVQHKVRDTETGQCLGLARWLTPPLAGWRGWFRRPILEVVESDDESLLCSLRRCWRPLPLWDVLDADGRFIGSLRRGVLLDPLGRRFAVLTARQFLDPQGEEVGTLVPMEDAIRLTFAAPFRKTRSPR